MAIDVVNYTPMPTGGADLTAAGKQYLCQRYFQKYRSQSILIIFQDALITTRIIRAKDTNHFAGECIAI